MKKNNQKNNSCPIDAYLEELVAGYSPPQGGRVADYIPQLALAKEEWFGICLVTTDGHVYEKGETRRDFTIQSASKPVAYGIALESSGREKTLSRVGVEPSGDAFNEISLDPKTGMPDNPMINAGAITTTGLVNGGSGQERLDKILETFYNYTGRRTKVDEEVYQSEKDTGHRNRAIAHMLRNFEMLEGDPEPALDLYFKQCSVLVNCRDLAAIAATLANGGVSPVSGQRAVEEKFVSPILSVMGTCGMYDYTGSWIYHVGIPAKSGVAGGIMAVLPGQIGIGVYSPPLDEKGNSVRGIEVLKDISRDFELHLFRPPRVSRSTIRAEYDATQVKSKRLRNKQEQAIIEKNGNQVRIFEVQSDLIFATTEHLVRNVINTLESTSFYIIDFKRVFTVNSGSRRLLGDLVKKLADKEKTVIFTNLENHTSFQDFFENDAEVCPLFFVDNDRALEWCEDRLLSSLNQVTNEAQSSIKDQALLAGMSDKQIDQLKALMRPVSFSKNDFIIKKGDPGDQLYFLLKGEASVSIQLKSGIQKRLSSFSPGMAFGEMAILDNSPRSADIRADEEVECMVLTLEDFKRLENSDLSIKQILLENLARDLAGKLRQSHLEIEALEG